MTGYWWVQIPVTVAVLLTAYLTIWRKGIRPLFRAVNEIAKAVPILAGIAREFQTNEGASLRDQIDSIRTDLSHHIEESHEARTEVGLRLRNVEQAVIPPSR